MPLHKDQKRVQSVIFPFLMLQANEEGAPAERDCTILNRALAQGPDPLYLMEVAPEQFASLCELLCLDVENGREAIESAHWQGPGVLLSGKGLVADREILSEMTKGVGSSSRIDGLPVAWRREMLWLLLASVSDCTEDNYADSVTVVERLQRATRAAINLDRFVTECTSVDALVRTAIETWGEFESTTDAEPDERGFPHTHADHGFYILYKQGYKCVAVHTPTMVFWGTTPDTSLEEQGVEVDKKISPQFGMVFS